MCAILQLVWAPSNPRPIVDHFRRSHSLCEHARLVNWTNTNTGKKHSTETVNKNMRMTPQYKTENKHAQKIENKMKNKTHMNIIKINNVCTRTRAN